MYCSHNKLFHFDSTKVRRKKAFKLGRFSRRVVHYSLLMFFTSFSSRKWRVFKKTRPAFRCNLFIFKEKIKRIFTAIGAKRWCFVLLRVIARNKAITLKASLVCRVTLLRRFQRDKRGGDCLRYWVLLKGNYRVFIECRFSNEFVIPHSLSRWKRLKFAGSLCWDAFSETKGVGIVCAFEFY